MFWANFLHLYQPPTLEREILDQVVRQSYRRLINILKTYSHLRLTLNITGCLTKRLLECGYQKIIQDIKKLTQKKQIELVGTAYNHSILPLVPEDEVIRQIRVNEEINKKYFGKSYKKQGFFLPEMAYSKRVARLIKRAGFKWLILDEISCHGKLDEVDFTKQYSIQDLGLKVIFRNRKISKSFVPESVRQILKEKNPPPFLMTATDAELYGHRHQDRKRIFQKILKNKSLKTITCSALLKLHQKQEVVSPLPSSWETLAEEIVGKIPYSLWQDPQNKLHQKLWQLAHLALKFVKKHTLDENYSWARLHLDQGLSSCTFWWASGRDFRLFGPPAWHPEEIEKGAKELLRSLRSLVALSPRTKLRAEKIYLEIKKIIWTKHWTYYWKNNNEK